MQDFALTYGGFAAFALLAALAQQATGFAFTLVLLGLSSLLGRVELATAANAASLLTLAQAGLQWRSRARVVPGAWLRPVLWGSVPGLVAGVLLLAWLQAQARAGLQGLLGALVLACALWLWCRPRPLPRRSSARVLWVTGALSGLLGGLFATAGPPLVLQMYRQPLPFEHIRQGLLQAFAAQAALRLLLVAASGTLQAPDLALAGAALPSLALAEMLRRRGVLPHELAQVRPAVVGLLALTGGLLLARASG